MSLAIDGSSPASVLASGGTVVTSASFTPPAGALLIACTEGAGGAGSNPTITITNSGSGTGGWSQLLKATKTSTAGSGNGGVAAIHMAVATGSALTVTSTMTSGSLPINLKVYVFTGFDSLNPIGANTKFAWSNVSHTTTSSFLSTANNSIIVCAAAEWLSSPVPTSSDLTIETYFVSGQSRGFSGFKTNATSGSTVTCDLNASGSDWLYCVIEVMPATGGHNVAVGQAFETDTAQQVLFNPPDRDIQLPPAYGPGIVGAPSSGMQVVMWQGATAGSATKTVVVNQVLETEFAQVIQGPLVRTQAFDLPDVITPAAALPPANDIGSYTSDETDAALHADSRTERFRYELLDNSNTSIMFLDDVLISGDVSYAHDNDIKRTATFTVVETAATDGINYEHDRLRPYYDILMPDGLWARFSLGIFLLSSPTRAIKKGIVTRDVSAYDLTAVLTQNATGNRYALALGANVIAAVKDILDVHGLDYVIGDSDEVLAAPKDWDPGTAWYEIIADLLALIAWRPLFFDSEGIGRTLLNATPADRQTDFHYLDDALSVLDPEVTEELDLWDVPNIWVLIATKPDNTPLVARFDNDNPDSPTSTVNRGRNVPKFVTDGIDATTQDALNAMAANMGFEDSQVFQSASFSTAIMPQHGDYNVIHLRYGALGIDHIYGESEWSFNMVPGSLMTHVARRVVDVTQPLEDDTPISTGTFIIAQTGEQEIAQKITASKTSTITAHTKTYAATWYRSYEEDGTIGRTPEPSVLYAGSTNGDDSWGKQKSLIGFDYVTIEADLVGAEITGCWFTWKQIHTWYTAGATWYIGTHNYTSKPTTSTGSTNVSARRFSMHVDRNTQYKHLLTVAIGNEFKSGATRGFVFGPPATEDVQYYGYTDDSPLILTITYNK